MVALICLQELLSNLNCLCVNNECKFILHYKSDAEWNESRYYNPRVDELIIKVRSQADPSDRKEAYEEIQRTLIDEVPRIIPVFGPIFRGLRLNVRDCEANQKSKLLLYKCWLDD